MAKMDSKTKWKIIAIIFIVLFVIVFSQAYYFFNLKRQCTEDILWCFAEWEDCIKANEYLYNLSIYDMQRADICEGLRSVDEFFDNYEPKLYNPNS